LSRDHFSDESRDEGGAMIRLGLLTLIAVSAMAAEIPRVVFTKTFPGSTPAYVSITVDRSGAVAYKETPDDDPEEFQLEPANTEAIFDLAEKLDHFKQPLESGLKVANMGMKTFRWENGAENSEAKFNYSSDEDARMLSDLFERITESERLLVTLRRAVRHDKLGVHQALIDIQVSWDRKRLMGTEQFLPLFDQVAKNEIYLHMARERAAQLADAIRNPKPKVP
jgi:hypothetical protein